MTIDKPEVMSAVFEELDARTYRLNDKAVDVDKSYILISLRRDLRAFDNPAIDLGIKLSETYQLPLIVHSQLTHVEHFQSLRFMLFRAGALNELSKGLAERKIQLCVTAFEQKEAFDTEHELFQNSACIIFDQHFTEPEHSQAQSVADSVNKLTFEVDACRLVPHSQFSKSLHITRAFRAAHSPMRDYWQALRADLAYNGLALSVGFAFDTIDIDSINNSEIARIARSCGADMSLDLAEIHPATGDELEQRLSNLITNIIPQYRKNRNNPALAESTSSLSPYLHYGMTSVFEIKRAIDASDISRSEQWKFNDELLTWREWSHWRLAKRPDYTQYESLPNSAKTTLDNHRDDPREIIVSEDDLFEGKSPDATWNAAQIYWRKTGWLHNNLRMYWAKQFLRWTKTPEEAWHLACKFNDKQSLDGRDPAVYISMRWAFGEAKPSYRENPVYGWVAKKSDRALKRREGFTQWADEILNSEKKPKNNDTSPEKENEYRK